MTNPSYHAPVGGLPPQTQLLSGRAAFTTAYVVIPGDVMTDIVTSKLPFWSDSRFWVISRPLSGFAETFSQYICEVMPGGGSERPEAEAQAQAVLFVIKGHCPSHLMGILTTSNLAGMPILPRVAIGPF